LLVEVRPINAPLLKCRAVTVPLDFCVNDLTTANAHGMGKISFHMKTTELKLPIREYQVRRTAPGMLPDWNGHVSLPTWCPERMLLG
jgi:hypothetical protein